ncbi:ribonuclease R [Ravibacter arvi]|uniref:Ribonuclease R n=1 Tax=Ravibacter arvi TaxID=2051041 RepID=A0ABP8LYG9_9BACT
MQKQKKPKQKSREFQAATIQRNYFSELVESIREELLVALEMLPDPVFRFQDLVAGLAVEDPKLRVLYQEIFQDLVVEGRVENEKEGLFRWLGGSVQRSGKPKPEAPFPAEVPGKAARKNGTLKADQFTGKVEHVNKGFAYVVVQGLERDIYVDTDDLRGAIDGDEVKVQLYGRRRNDHEQGRVVEILNDVHQQVVGVLSHGGRYAFVRPDNRRIYEPVDIPLNEINGAVNGDKVIVELTSRASRSRPALGKVTSVLGKAGDHNTEMHAILAEFGLPNEFPDEIITEAEAIPEQIDPSEIKGRKDFRKVLTVTIDPVDAKDFDDALSFKKLANGNTEVGVHIADVSHYVRPGTPIDAEAYQRGTSVYLVDRTVPMLPEKLSNNLCSLRPHEDRLAFSAVFEMNPQAEVVKEWFGRTVIHSDRRFAYEEAQEVLETGTGDYADELKTLNELAKSLNRERFREGAINFETTEVKFVLDETGRPVGLTKKVRKDAHKLIEEFMLLANKRVAEFVFRISKKKSEPNTMIYRIHEPPDQDKLNTFSVFVARLGYSLDVSNEEKLAKSMNGMLHKAEGKPEQNLLETLAVRTMAKARYSTEDIGHFGLAFQRYSHFTSPIRRYPDLMAHRLLQHYLDKGASVDAEELEKKCMHCSERERLATDAERASIKYKQVEYMSLQEEDKVYEGVISGVTEFGMFVEISETASEGLVRMNDLNDDYYEVDKENYRLVGERSGRIFTFGDPVKVRVKETNLSRRSMDLTLVDAFSVSRRRGKATAGKTGKGKIAKPKRDKGRSARRRR